MGYKRNTRLLFYVRFSRKNTSRKTSLERKQYRSIEDHLLLEKPCETLIVIIVIPLCIQSLFLYPSWVAILVSTIGIREGGSRYLVIYKVFVVNKKQLNGVKEEQIWITKREVWWRLDDQYGVRGFEFLSYLKRWLGLFKITCLVCMVTKTWRL